MTKVQNLYAEQIINESPYYYDENGRLRVHTLNEADISTADMRLDPKTGKAGPSVTVKSSDEAPAEKNNMDPRKEKMKQRLGIGRKGSEPEPVGSKGPSAKLEEPMKLPNRPDDVQPTNPKMSDMRGPVREPELRTLPAKLPPKEENPVRRRSSAPEIGRAHV